MTTPPEERTKRQQRFEDDLIEALDTIAAGWDSMLKPPAKRRPGAGRGGGALLEDDSPSSADLDRLTGLIAVRVAIADDLQDICAWVIKKHDVTNGLPTVSSVPSMVHFLTRWAPRLADDATASVLALAKRGARAVERIVNPAPKSLSLGPCPLYLGFTDEEGEEQEEPCSGTVRSDGDNLTAVGDAWATCSSCGTKAVAEWWAEQAGTDPNRTLSVDEIVGLAYREYGRSISQASVWKWKQSDEIGPVNPNEKPHRFKLSDVSDLLVRKYSA